MTNNLTRRNFLGATAALATTPVWAAAPSWNAGIRLHFTPLEYDSSKPEMVAAVEANRDSWWLAENFRVTRSGGWQGNPYQILQRRADFRCYLYNPAEVPQDMLLWDQAAGGPERSKRIALTKTDVQSGPMPNHGIFGAPAFYFDFTSKGDIPAIAFERSTFLTSAQTDKGTWMLICRIAGPATVLPKSDTEGVWFSPGHVAAMIGGEAESEAMMFLRA